MCLIGCLRVKFFDVCMSIFVFVCFEIEFVVCFDDIDLY